MQVRGETNYDIVIYVDSSIYIDEDLKESIDTYVADIQSEGWSNKTIIVDASEEDPGGIKGVLVTCRGCYNIKGCVLIGDFPYAKWEDHINGSWYPTDYYYMDLDGNWCDSDNDTVLDSHSGNIRPEIWVARLMASTINDPTRDEPELYDDYFEKNHLSRNASSHASHCKQRALAYVDNDIALEVGDLSDPNPVRNYEELFVNDTIDCLQSSYNDVTLITSPLLNATNTNAADYKNRLENGDSYEWTWVYDHGWPDSHAFANYQWNGSYWLWGFWNEGSVSSDDYYIPHTPKSYFYIFGSCSAAKFVEENSVANSAIFGKGNCLTSIGMTEDGTFPAFWFFDAFDKLGEHECIGEAFETMYNSMIDYYNGTYVYNKLTLLGDPTIGINSPPNTPSQPSGPTSGYLGVDYEYTTNATDLNGDQIWYQFDWGNGENTTVGPYNSGETGNASHAWSYAGTYSIKVRTKDGYELWSDWSDPLNVTTDGRILYMQNAKWDSTYWKLLGNNTSTYTSQARYVSGLVSKGYLGVKVYKGTTCISGDSVVQVGCWLAGQSFMQSATWNCPEQNVTDTYLKVEIWYKLEGYSWTYMGVAFKTQTFQQDTVLDAATWTIYLYGRVYQVSPLGPPTEKTYVTFYWGSSSKESRIQDVFFTCG